MRICGESIRVVHPLFPVEGGGSIPTSPLQLHIGEIDLSKAMQLNAAWHSRLPVTSQSNLQRMPERVCYGAEYLGRFYAVAIWTSPIARMLNGRGWLELRRLAIANDAPKFTATRMLKVMRLLLRKKLPHIVRLISYQDTEVHAGTIYRAAGWSEEAKNPHGDWVRARRDSVSPVAAGAKVRWGIAA